MDFMNRSNSQPQPAHQSVPSASTSGAAPSPASTGKARHQQKVGQSSFFKATAIALLFALTIIVLAVIGMLAVGNTNSDQSKYVNTDKYQAVFLTNGQVYFGKLTNIGKDYFHLTNIYYLTQNTTTDSSGNSTGDGNYTLVKLGCQQIHDPYDEMVISRNQISFWENINSDGKVVKSIGEYATQNKGKSAAEICATTSTQTQASDTSKSTQGGSTPTTTKNP